MLESKKSQWNLPQAPLTLIKVMFIVAVGILLSQVLPIINTFVDLAFQSNPGILLRITLYLLVPFAWIFYLLGSYVWIRSDGLGFNPEEAMDETF